MRTEIPENYDMPPEISIRELGDVLMNERRCVLFYDIETQPAPEETLAELFTDEEVKLPNYPGVFDPMKVKYGNMKDPEKRQAKLNEEIAKHELALASWHDDCQKAKDEAWVEFKHKATLKPHTGRVMSIGYGLKRGTETQLCLDVQPTDERILLLRFWRLAGLIRKRDGKLVSFNGHSFDLPFLVRRSWAYEDVNPLMLLNKYRKYEDFCIDALEVYRQGGSWSDSIKLDRLAQMMGVQRKLEGMTGDMFWQVYRDDPERALDYMALDVHSLAAVAERMRLV